MQYVIRQAKAEDINILDSIHTQNMKSYVERNYPWNTNLFREHFSLENYEVIETNKQIIGFIKIVFSEAEIYLGEIQIAKNYQNKGIGTSLIMSVIQKAKKNDKKLWLKVLKGNPAKRLYCRLGFIKVEESMTHEIMIYCN